MTTDKTSTAVREPYDAMGPTDAPNPPAAPTTMATVKHGGCVQLGDWPSIEERARELLAAEYAMAGSTKRADKIIAGFDCAPATEYALRAIVATLSAQPSPGGQDALLESLVVRWRAEAAAAATSDNVLCQKIANCTTRHAAELKDALAARQPVEEQHTDDLAVDAFAAAMKAKMAEARAKGRGGWEDPAQCSADDLSRMLREHVEKGDTRDVANFCMMLHQRGEAIAARQPVGEPVDSYESAYQEVEPPPLVVNAAGFRALESFLTVAEEFRRSTEPYIEAINEGGSAGDDEISEVFDRHLNYAKTAVSRSTVYTAPPAQAVDLERARNEGHDGAIRYVLGYLCGMGDWGSTQYVEILNGCGRESIIRSAIEDGELEFTGLGRWVAERGTDEERALVASKAVRNG